MRRLRVGDYRVVFRIAQDEVLVVGIGHRKLIYAMMEARGVSANEAPERYGKERPAARVKSPRNAMKKAVL